MHLKIKLQISPKMLLDKQTSGTTKKMSVTTTNPKQGEKI
jgi:hypothetical protein